MDESWRMSSIGDHRFVHNSSTSSRRRSTEKDHRRMNNDPAAGPADEDDFRDVFGGPPRLLLLLLPPRPPAAGFYDEVFSPQAASAAGSSTGRRNQQPGLYNNTSTSISTRRLLGSVATEDGFYDDIFGSSDFLYTSTAVLPSRDRRPRSSSSSTTTTGNNCKSRCKSYDHGLSNSPLRANPLGRRILHHRHATLSSIASKLRPITIPTRPQHNSSRSSALSRGGVGGGGGNRTLPINNIHFSSFSRQYLHPCADTNSYCTNCCRKPSVHEMTNNVYHSSNVGSPSSDIFEPMSTTTPIELRELEKKVVLEVKRERECSSVNHHFVRETEGAGALDEAIAWAREKFWKQQASDGSDEILEYSEQEAAKGSKEKALLNGDHLKKKA